jgi:hypothetical protein
MRSHFLNVAGNLECDRTFTIWLKIGMRSHFLNVAGNENAIALSQGYGNWNAIALSQGYGNWNAIAQFSAEITQIGLTKTLLAALRELKNL